MGLSDRYTKVTDAFNTIRDDAKTMVEQLEDGKINSWERLQNAWMKATRGDIPARFDKIKKVYLDVAKDTNDQIEREHTILTAYQDFRGALKEAEILALQVLKTAEQKLQAQKRSSRRRCKRWSRRRPTTSSRARSSSSRVTRRCARCSSPRTAIRSARTSRTT